MAAGNAVSGVRYLSGVARPEFCDLLPRDDLGLMWTAKAFAGTQHPDGAVWAADNGCFSGAWREDRWLRWLDRMRDTPGCLFAVAPDVLCDAAATARRAAPYFERMRQLGYRVAFVLQNGQEDRPMPWDSIDAVFIGGDTPWKLSRHAARLTYEAKDRGLYVHMGRANSAKRLRRAAELGCDSADGTFLRWGKPGENLPRLLDMLRKVGELPALPLGVAA